jgi:hypothetical protein
MATTISFEIFLLGCFIIIMFNRNQMELKALSPALLGLMLFGCAILVALGWVSALGVIKNDSKDNVVQNFTSVCVTIPWIMSLGWTLVSIPLLSKTLRLYYIFQGVRTKIKDTQIFLATIGMLGLDSVILAIWQALSSSSPQVVTNGPDHCMICSSSLSSVFVPTILSYKILLILIGAFTTFKVRNVTSAFNETKAISFTYYNTLIWAIIIPSLIQVNSANIDIQIVLLLVGIYTMIGGVLFFMFFPKVIVLTIGAKIPMVANFFSPSDPAGTAISGKFSSISGSKLSLGNELSSQINLSKEKSKGSLLRIAENK